MAQAHSAYVDPVPQEAPFKLGSMWSTSSGRVECVSANLGEGARKKRNSEQLYFAEGRILQRSMEGMDMEEHACESPHKRRKDAVDKGVHRQVELGMKQSRGSNSSRYRSEDLLFRSLHGEEPAEATRVIVETCAAYGRESEPSLTTNQGKSPSKDGTITQSRIESHMVALTAALFCSCEGDLVSDEVAADP